MSKIFTKLKELEEDKSVAGNAIGGPNSQNSAASFNKTVTSSTASGAGGFFNSNTNVNSSQYPSS